jgi:1-acyl-sn-glycerol-3-phosphate acyltransferase
MTATTYAGERAWSPAPHGWQTQPWARALRRAGRHWVMSRHVRSYCRPLTIEGAEHLRDVHGPALIIANHSSHFDTPVVLSALPERIRAKTAVAAAADRFYAPGKRGWWFSLFFNAYPIERGGGRDALDYSLALIERGWSLLVYPEGTRSRSGEVQPFRHGAAILAMAGKMPVVPVYTEGLRDVMPKGERIPRPAPVSVRIGEPVSLEGISSAHHATVRLQGALHALALTSQGVRAA